MKVTRKKSPTIISFRRALLLLSLCLIFAWWNISQQSSNIQLRSDGKAVQVLATDFIYQPGWGKAPIVVESHKLIFFTIPKVACSVWKQLFRRMEGYDDWKSGKINVHNPKVNGLRYLNQYSLKNATRILNDPSYTKAVFVRDPKDRFLSAYLEKGLKENGHHVQVKCCPSDSNRCWPESNRSFAHFFDVTRTCSDTHWNPMHERLEAKFLPLIDFIGSMDHLQEDAKQILQRIGAWEEYGASGWGVDGTERIFESKSSVNHATSGNSKDAWERMKRYYTPELERAVQERFDRDYSTFQLPRKAIDFKS